MILVALKLMVACGRHSPSTYSYNPYGSYRAPSSYGSSYKYNTYSNTYGSYGSYRQSGNSSSSYDSSR